MGFHQWLVFSGTAVGLWGFGFGVALLLREIGGPGWLWPLFFVAAILGGRARLLAHAADRGAVPFVWWACVLRGRARKGSHFPIQYRCVSCGDVHRTGLNEGR